MLITELTPVKPGYYGPGRLTEPRQLPPRVREMYNLEPKLTHIKRMRQTEVLRRCVLSLSQPGNVVGPTMDCLLYGAFS